MLESTYFYFNHSVNIFIRDPSVDRQHGEDELAPSSALLPFYCLCLAGFRRWASVTCLFLRIGVAGIWLVGHEANVIEERNRT
jgi:hypothetical protein